MANVYLAGPIEGCTEEERNSWRNDIKNSLLLSDITSFSPDDAQIENRADEHEIFHKDLFQIRQCDIVLVNLEHMNKKSFGTPFEMGYAYAMNKLIVVVAREDQLYHPFVTMGSVFFTDLAEAREFIKDQLTLY